MTTSNIRMSIAAALVAIIAIFSSAPASSSVGRQTATPPLVVVTPVSTVTFDPTPTSVWSEETPVSTFVFPTKTPTPFLTQEPITPIATFEK